MDARLAGVCRLLRPSGDARPSVSAAADQGVWNLVEHHIAQGSRDARKLVVGLHGPRGVGKLELARGLSARLQMPILTLDAQLAVARGPEAEPLLRLALRESLIQHALVLVEHADILQQESSNSLLHAMRLAIVEFGSLVLLSGVVPWTVFDAVDGIRFHSVELPVPDVPARAALWAEHLSDVTPDAEAWAAQLAAQFHLTPGQIGRVVELARNRVAMEPAGQALSPAAFASACREQSNQKLRELAVKVEPHYGWDDLVLPERPARSPPRDLQPGAAPVPGVRNVGLRRKAESRQGPERAVHRPARHRQDDGRRSAGARPGTGSLQGRSVGRGQQVHRRDRERTFRASSTKPRPATPFCSSTRPTRCSASAPRSATRTIATPTSRPAYLLQKMEEYEGVVILATNLRENMDDAFTRRIRFIVEFPFPDEGHRRRESGKRTSPRLRQCHPTSTTLTSRANSTWPAATSRTSF